MKNIYVTNAQCILQDAQRDLVKYIRDYSERSVTNNVFNEEANVFTHHVEQVLKRISNIEEIINDIGWLAQEVSSED